MSTEKQISPHKQQGTYERVPTNEYGQAIRLKCSACDTIHVRSFHITWISFWFCFFAWFCTTNIYVEISADITTLTIDDHILAGTLSVTSTIFFRLIISYLCPILGSRICYVIILVSTIISLTALSLVESSIGYIIIHIFIGIAGASFVVTEYHTTRMFSGKVVGFAQATSAGFGNFGGGCANFLMPVMINNTLLSWRAYIGILAGFLFILCFVYYFGSHDAPNPDNEQSTSFIVSPNSNKVPDKRAGGSLIDVVCDYRSWILFICYAGCFGVELTFYLMAAEYFQQEHGLTEIMSGLLVMIWSSVNLFSRPIGGYFSDKYSLLQRVKLLFVILFLESIFIILFGALGHFSLVAAIIMMLLFSICVQFAEGVTFSIVPFIQEKSVGHVIGIVGSGGNFGATLFVLAAFLPFENVDHWSWIVLGCIVMVFSFSALLLKFSEREIHDLDAMIKPAFDLEILKTQYKLPQMNGPEVYDSPDEKKIRETAIETQEVIPPDQMTLEST